MTEVQTYTATIFIAGDYSHATQVCQEFCMSIGLCVTIEPVEYIYTGGRESGVRIGLINYPRFPDEPNIIFDKALCLARLLRTRLAQHSFSVVATDKTIFETTRE